MADPTALVERTFKVDVDRKDTLIKTSEALVIGGALAIDVTTGLAEFMDDTVDLMPIGIALKQTQGDNESLTGDGTVKVTSRTGIVLENQTVTGVSAITDTFKLVYMTDGQTFTLTAPTTGNPVGFVKKWRATTYCDVQLFTLSEMVMWCNIPRSDTICLGYIGTNALTGTAALDLLTYTANRRMQIDTLFAYPTNVDNASVAGAQTCNLEIGAVNLTGGVLTLAYTSCDADADIGTKISATAITAANIASAGEVITLELVTGGTGFTADTVSGFMVFMGVTYLPGA